MVKKGNYQQCEDDYGNHYAVEYHRESGRAALLQIYLLTYMIWGSVGDGDCQI